MEVKEVIEIALKAGEILINNGAETYRVEETIEKICNSYNVECECISLATGIFISVKDNNNEIVTSIKRIHQRGVDLSKIEMVNSFSREVVNNTLDYKEAKMRLDKIENAPCFSFFVRIFAACLTCFVYTIFFTGSVNDAFVSIFIGGFVYILLDKISRVGVFQFFQFYLSGFIIGGVSLVIGRVVPHVDKNNIIVGSIMILLPGVALTNGIKDILYGDFTSGFAKFGEAALTITAVGAGIGTALAIGLKWM